MLDTDTETSTTKVRTRQAETCPWVRSSAAGYRHSSPKMVGGQRLTIVVKSHDQTTWEIQQPRCLHQPPSGFYLLREIAKLNLLTQPEQFVCEPDSGPSAATLINEKTNRNLRSIHDVEGVDDIVESKAHGLTG